MRHLLFILLFLTTPLIGQLGLFNEGGDGLTFYIGQDDVVQAEGDVSNLTGATIEFENGGTPTLGLKGDFLNSTSGVYTLGTEKIEFNGSSLQSADFGGDNIYGLRTNNSADVSIDRNVTITGDLEFSTGHVLSTTSAYPTLGTSATATGADDDSHNNGPIAKNFDATTEFTFPVGDGTDYRYDTFTPATTAAVTIRTQYFGVKHWDKTLNAPLYKVSQVEHWDIYRTSGTTNGVVTLSWDAKSGGVGDITDLVVAHYDGTDWNSAGGNNPTGNTAAGDVESDAAWSIYDRFFTLATTTLDNALPVELIRFDAEKENESVRLDWETASEINSDYFAVLKSSNGIDFEEFDQVKSAGESTELQYYFSYDYNPFSGSNYYKIKNIDNDGSAQDSEVKMINFADETSVSLSTKIYPNPSSNYTNFEFNSNEEGIFKIQIIDITGKLVYSSRILGPIGTNTFTVNVDLFESGKYLVNLISPSGNMTTTSLEKI